MQLCVEILSPNYAGMSFGSDLAAVEYMFCQLLNACSASYLTCSAFSLQFSLYHHRLCNKNGLAYDMSKGRIRGLDIGLVIVRDEKSFKNQRFLSARIKLCELKKALDMRERCKMDCKLTS